jgi:hypothetical protein
MLPRVPIFFIGPALTTPLSATRLNRYWLRMQRMINLLSPPRVP